MELAALLSTNIYHWGIVMLPVFSNEAELRIFLFSETLSEGKKMAMNN